VAHEPLPQSLVVMLKGMERLSRSACALSHVLRLCREVAGKTHKMCSVAGAKQRWPGDAVAATREPRHGDKPLRDLVTPVNRS